MRLTVIGEHTLVIELPISELGEQGFSQEDFKRYNPEIRKYIYSVIDEQSLLEFSEVQPIHIGISIINDTVLIHVIKRSHIGHEMIGFATFEDLLLATSRVLLKYKGISKSKLFVYEKRYYIKINLTEVTKRNRNRMDNILSILEEFGDYQDYTEEFLGEHGKCLINKGAISLIGKLA